MAIVVMLVNPELKITCFK